MCNSSFPFAVLLISAAFLSQSCFRPQHGTSQPPPPSGGQPQTQRGEQQRVRQDAEPPVDLPDAAPAQDAGRKNEVDLAGTWVMQAPIAGMQCTSEFIFERTGTYSGLATCDNGFGGTYMTRSVGDWKMLQPGMVRIQYTDHEPKEYAGRPVYYPDGETMAYSVIDNDHLNTSSGVMTRRY